MLTTILDELERFTFSILQFYKRVNGKDYNIFQISIISQFNQELGGAVTTWVSSDGSEDGKLIFQIYDACASFGLNNKFK